MVEASGYGAGAAMLYPRRFGLSEKAAWLWQYGSAGDHLTPYIGRAAIGEAAAKVGLASGAALLATHAESGILALHATATAYVARDVYAVLSYAP